MGYLIIGSVLVLLGLIDLLTKDSKLSKNTEKNHGWMKYLYVVEIVIGICLLVSWKLGWVG
jgi:hypothetical protein